MREYYKQLLAKTSETLDEIDKFIENSTTVAHEKNLNSSTLTIKEIESLIKNLCTKNPQSPESFTSEFFHAFLNN